MPSAISDTSPLLYLYRIDALSWLPHLFNSIWVPTAVSNELSQGRKKGRHIAPFVDALGKKGMWVSGEIRRRILALADERERMDQ